jgi:predicted enzyme related to lactoylglutathione lyase
MSSRGRPAHGQSDAVRKKTVRMIESISAITLATHDMAAAVQFYTALGFDKLYGGDTATFTSFRAGTGYVNLTLQPADKVWAWWGRAIFYVADVDALYGRVVAGGYKPHAAPRDAEWGERFFHVTDPDGHELSFARPLR